MNSAVPLTRWQRLSPVLLLMLLAPAFTEILPGATRFSSLFVLPIEILVWGGGAVLIREIVRVRRLGWTALLFLGLALAVAEECVIQQTSLAPMVLKLKGVEYARAFGVNYVYALWALVYETVFVIFVPIAITELVFPERRKDAWVSPGGRITLSCLFLLGSFFAWFSWTQIARPKVFHVPLFHPPLGAKIGAFIAILVLAFLALRGKPRTEAAPDTGAVPPRWALFGAGAIWAALWYGLVLLSFGLAPNFSPAIAVVAGLSGIALMLLLVPQWLRRGWYPLDSYALGFGTLAGSMLVSFIGFFGAAPLDLGFKILVDLIATVLLVRLGFKLRDKERSFQTG